MKIQIMFISNDAQTHKSDCCCDNTDLNKQSPQRWRTQMDFKSERTPLDQGRNQVMLWPFVLCVNSLGSCLMQSAGLHKLLCNLLTIFTKVWQQWPLAATAAEMDQHLQTNWIFGIITAKYSHNNVAINLCLLLPRPNFAVIYQIVSEVNDYYPALEALVWRWRNGCKTGTSEPTCYTWIRNLVNVVK